MRDEGNFNRLGTDKALVKHNVYRSGLLLCWLVVCCSGDEVDYRIQ